MLLHSLSLYCRFSLPALLLLLMRLPSCSAVTPSTDSELAPVGCKANPSTINLGDSATITLSATTPKGTMNTYRVSVPQGSIHGSGTTETLNTQGATAGKLTVTCKVENSNGLSAAATATVTIAPQVLGPSIPANYFGLTLQDFEGIEPEVQYATTRTWDAYAGSASAYPGLDWPHISQTPGAYDFTALDAFINYNESRDADIIYTFGRVPQWASTNPNEASCNYGPGQCAPPTPAAWNSFVRAIVTHAAGRIKYWEIWNEPNNPSSYSGSIPTMVTLAQSAYQIVKSIDPSAVVLSPAVTASSGPGWLSTYLSDGGDQSTEAIAFHGYGNGVAEDISSIVKTYKTVLSAHGLSNLPLWDTESGWADGDGAYLVTLSSSQQAAFVAKYYLLQWPLGVSRSVWYAFDGTAQWGQMWDPADGLQPDAVAYQQVSNWMIGASMTSPCGLTGNGIWTCGLARPGGYEAQVLWDSTGSANWQTAGKFVQYRDLSGSVTPLSPQQLLTIGNQPVLLETGNQPD